MKEDFQKLMQLVKTDETLRKKLEEAEKSYTGERTEEAVFDAVIAPAAKEAGLSVSFEDVKQARQELDPDEMSQVAGGVSLGGGIGAFSCMTGGFGIGYGGGPGAGGVCFIVGFGSGGIACYTAGVTGTEEDICTEEKRY